MRTRFVVAAIAAIFLASLLFFFVSELTPGVYSDSTDWAMYVMHARNIVTGHPYAETGYVFQPESTTEVGANAYPSGVPLILAPFYAVRGVDLKLFKTLNVSFLVLSLWPAYLYARRTLSPVSSLVIIVSLGLSTLFFSNFDAIGSDSPYQFIAFWVLLFLLRIYDKGLNETKPIVFGVLAGLVMAAAYLLRPFGVAFLVAIAATEILKKRRITLFLLAVAGAFIPLVFFNNFFFHADGGYAHQFTFAPKAVIRHAIDYAGYFSYAFANPVSKLYRYFLWAATLIPVAIGVVKRIREGKWGVTELYLLTLLAVLAVYWATNARYLLPIMPFYLVYMFEGFQSMASRVSQRFTLPLKAAAAALLLFAPAANAVLVRPNPEDTLVTSPRYEALCTAIRNQTPKNSLLIFWNPRVLAFSTARFASGWPAEGKPGELTQYLSRVHPGYIVVDKNHQDDRQFLIPFIAASPAPPTAIFENEQFRLIRLLPDASKQGSE
jgi:hypothetical protein